jgi:HTH-type transcriptional regulator/antitoxin HigA
MTSEISWKPERGTVPPPGETLREWLAEQRRTQKWLAGQLGCSTHHVNQIVGGRSGYSEALATRLSLVTGISTAFWLNLQYNYQVNQAGP